MMILLTISKPRFQFVPLNIFKRTDPRFLDCRKYALEHVIIEKLEKEHLEKERAKTAEQQWAVGGDTQGFEPFNKAQGAWGLGGDGDEHLDVNLTSPQ